MATVDHDCDSAQPSDGTFGSRTARLWHALTAFLTVASHRRPVLALLICGAVLAVGIDACALVLIAQQRARILNAAEREISGLATVLGRRIERDFQSLEFLENGLVDQFRAMKIETSQDFNLHLSGNNFHNLLKEKALSLPHVGSITLVNSGGTVINFSRSWPIPQIDVTDRDFFTTLKNDVQQSTFVSAPVRNRATGSMVVH